VAHLQQTGMILHCRSIKESVS